MSKKIITLSKLERLFNQSDFATLFTHYGKGEINPPSTVFESFFFTYDFWDYRYLKFPLRNFCIERYCLNNQSFARGETVVTIGLPFLVVKKENRLFVEKIYPFLWKFLGIIKDDEGGEYYQEIIQTLHDEIHKRYFSSSELLEQSKKCFVRLKYDFLNTSQEDQGKLTKMLDELFERDAFIEFVCTILCPIIVYFYLEQTQCLVQKRKAFNSLLSV